jgi:hypothetical protein
MSGPRIRVGKSFSDMGAASYAGRTSRIEAADSADAAAQAEGIMPQGDAHRALGDCLNTLALLRRMAEHVPVPSRRDR